MVTGSGKEDKMRMIEIQDLKDEETRKQQAGLRSEEENRNDTKNDRRKMECF